MIVFLAFVMSVLAGQPMAASFDCRRARTAVERTICASEELSALDGLLGRFYAGALDRLDQSACLSTDQREWLQKTRNRCADGACLRSAYLERLSALLALQPGMNVPRDLALPPAPRLRWIIPPLDPVDTPKLQSAPYEASGTIGYVLDKGGYVLETPQGTVHTLVPELAIDAGSQTHLGVLRDQKVRVIVRGRHAVVNRTERMFDNRYCVAIYERPD